MMLTAVSRLAAGRRPLLDEVVGEQVDSGMVGMDALLLGRRTYDIFAAYWPGKRGRLFDRLTLWVYPILLGGGKKVFAGGVVPTNLRLIEPVVASPKGAVLQRYALADGTPGVGDMSASDQEG